MHSTVNFVHVGKIGGLKMSQKKSVRDWGTISGGRGGCMGATDVNLIRKNV